MSIYNVYFLEENDNIRILFDRLNLVNDLVDLYHDIGVSLNIVGTNDKLTQSEKEMITTVLGNTTFKNNTNVRSSLLDILANTKKLFTLKKSIIDPDNTRDVTKYNTPTLIPTDINVHDTSQDIEAYNSEKVSFIQLDKVPPAPTPEFMSTYTFIMDTWWKENKDKGSTKNSLCILYNLEYECCLIREYNKKIKDISVEFGDFEIIREYKDITEKNECILRDLISNNMYCNKDTLEKKLEAFESLYDTKYINQVEDEKSLILFYIKQNYVISDNVSKRIKVSTLVDEVQRELAITNPNLKYSFANLLSVLGLRKKRFADGMYLYGIESKACAKVQETLQVKCISNKDYEAFVKSREKEIRELYANKH